MKFTIEQSSDNNEIEINIKCGQIIDELKEKYAKDKMFISTHNGGNSFFMHYLNSKGYNFSVGNNENIIINLDTTLDSIKIIDDCREYIDSFEVIKGSMDDVFLEITGKGIE